jgi:hypothetical protein
MPARRPIRAKRALVWRSDGRPPRARSEKSPASARHRADRVHRPGRVGERIGDRALVVNVDRNRSQVWVIARKEFAAAIGMPAGDPHREPVAAQMADYSAAEESGCIDRLAGMDLIGCGRNAALARRFRRGRLLLRPAPSETISLLRNRQGRSARNGARRSNSWGWCRPTAPR